MDDVLVNTKDKNSTTPGKKGADKRRSAIPITNGGMSKQSTLALWGAAGVVMAVVIGGWYFFLPLTYGKPGLSVEEVIRRKWLGYDLHFAK